MKRNPTIGIAAALALALSTTAALAVVKNGTSRGETLQGTNGADTLDGRGGDDRVLGYGGNDRLRGGFGNDSVQGGLGDDQCEGGDGADTLTGAAGNDRLTGGPGRDIFAFKPNQWGSLPVSDAGDDVILDFQGAGPAPGDRINVGPTWDFATLDMNGDGVLTAAGDSAIEKESAYVISAEDGSLVLKLAQDGNDDTGHPGAWAALTVRGVTSLSPEDFLFN